MRPQKEAFESINGFSYIKIIVIIETFNRDTPETELNV